MYTIVAFLRHVKRHFLAKQRQRRHYFDTSCENNFNQKTIKLTFKICFSFLPNSLILLIRMHFSINQSFSDYADYIVPGFIFPINIHTTLILCSINEEIYEDPITTTSFSEIVIFNKKKWWKQQRIDTKTIRWITILLLLPYREI